MASLKSILQILLPKKTIKKDGNSLTGSYNPAAPNTVLTLPLYRDHLTDIFSSRANDDSRALMKSLFKNDPDVSATVNVFMTLANTDALILVRDLAGQIDREAIKNLHLLIQRVCLPNDYTQGFDLKPSFAAMCENFRYMLLLRGCLPAELIYDKTMQPDEIRLVDAASLEWFEKAPGQYKPRQRPAGSNTIVDLDIPQFFVTFFRRDPTEIYSHSFFVAAINTIAARQQVVNDLYRIMQLTGFPRLDVEVMEEILQKSAPASARTDPEKIKAYVSDRMNEIRVLFENIRADQALVHLDSVKPRILNEKNPAAQLDISAVIDVLNSQNQAALKTMATVIGRGTQGAGTASVEARIAAMNADELNAPIASLLSNLFSFMLHQTGYQGFAEVKFKKVELRADLELEPQLMLRASRLLADLSFGLITDDEYHMMMYGRIRPDAVPELSGTGFQVPASDNGTTATAEGDPLGKSLAGPKSKAAKGNAAKPKKGK